MSLAIEDPPVHQIKKNETHSDYKSDWVSIARSYADQMKLTATERERKNQLPYEETKFLRESRLVNLLIPKKFGGEGATLREAMHVIIELSRGDGSVGGLLGYHFINSSIPRQFDFKGEAEQIERKSAENNWLWGNVSQPFEKNFRADPRPGGGFIINGVKKWCTGPSLGDVTTVLAPRTDIKEMLFAYIPTRRKGLTYHDDWDHLGLRLTDTVTISFDNVEVLPDEVIHSSHDEPQVSFPPFYGFGGIFFSSFYIGSSLAAFESAREYTKKISSPRPGRGEPTKDPYILTDYGEFWVKLQSVIALADDVADEMQKAWDNRFKLTRDEINSIQIRSSVFRSYAAKVGLEITSRVYDVMGAHASANRFGYDRHWRDIRAHTLHDPLVNTLRGIGDYVLNGTIRSHPSFVS